MSDLSALPRLLAVADWPAAERLLRRAARPGAAAAVFYNLAKVLEAQGKTGQVAHWLGRAVAADPGHAKAWFELGRAQHAAGDSGRALVAFRKAATLDPADTEAWRMVLHLALRLCDWAGAEAALDHLPDGPGTAAARYRVLAETGRAGPQDRAALLADPAGRPEALKALTRVAKGSLPLRLPAGPGKST
jgi:tetratricopeptide (TPR) repeat protein